MGASDRKNSKRKSHVNVRQKKPQRRDSIKDATKDLVEEKDKQLITIGYNDLVACCSPFVIPASSQINDQKYSHEINLSLLYGETANPASSSYKSTQEVSKQKLMNSLIESMQLLDLIPGKSLHIQTPRSSCAGLDYSDSEEVELDDEDVDVEHRLAQMDIDIKDLFDPQISIMKAPQESLGVVTHDEAFDSTPNGLVIF
ncbi:hypothetical protein OGAPHI_002465 [Ogataea philodendri]|uniref:Uncharacterized protein n=1 Tax=Ogataea philodendri TaxID=1378263 RepID=A0A9P8PBH6_9ASCO|nr:uncharacterized protein OGAPHI_002465 [Ogataea philodendri]KAH3668711.1 hypothetical protein OGAPHI_002465 [Ogataea philodendri]